MNSISKIKIDELIHLIGLEYGLPDETIREIWKSQFEFTAEKIKEFDFNTLNHIDDLGTLKTTFLFKSFCKLYVSPKAVDSHIKRIKRKNNE